MENTTNTANQTKSSSTKVFIDCGAHCGESIVRAKQQFGIDTQVMSFEAVPQLAEALQEIHKDDNSVEVINAAVFTDSEIHDIHLSPAFTDGSSIFSTLNDNHKGSVIQVPAFDLTSWIAEAFTEQTYIILKLDIEGAEYDVLEKLISTGVINMVDELWGEWHHGHISDNLEGEDKRLFFERAARLENQLADLNKPMQTWEAYYTDHPLLAKRPKALG